MHPTRLSLIAALAWTTVAAATPANKTALIDYLGTKAGVSCRTCHVAELPASDDFEHNAFGSRLAAARKELREAGKPADVRARLATVAEDDSDGDGASNILELLAGHNPGSDMDRPTAAKLADSDALRARHRTYLAGYQWRPFEPVRRPPVPANGESHPVDAFLDAERRERKIVARPPAPAHVLLRRVYLDLIGVPPTPAELEGYLADPSPDSFERVVDRLLASPLYGERWGRHWMDVWRYSDWAGYGAEVRESQPHVWRWRDWIVESLNADGGYDRMVREMLAGDEIAPDDPATLRATGFLVRNYYKFSRNAWLDNAVEHTAKAFLGVTLNCARCHDHMYDPFSQAEYYSFKAIFEPHQVRTDRVPGQPDPAKLGLVRTFDADLTPATFLLTRGDEKMPDKERPCAPGVPASLGGKLVIRPVALPRDVYQPNRRAWVIVEDRAAARQAVRSAEAAAAASRKVLARGIASGFAANGGLTAVPFAAGLDPLNQIAARDRTGVAASQAAYAALESTLLAEQIEADGRLSTADCQRLAELATVAQRQNRLAGARRDVAVAEVALALAPPAGRAALATKLSAARGALTRAEAEAAAPLTADFARRPQPKYPTTSTGRRTALAQWITAPDNPLAARVAVNHMWARHFGQPLVATAFDFGRNGQPPTHPALLDWLAAEFVDAGWSMKRLHRLLVTSRAYRADSRPDAASMALDPDNRYYWRMAPRRVEAEAVRDGVLAVAGRLDRTMGGPDLDHATGLTTFRRSIYYRHANEKQMTFLAAFDAANVNECYRRHASVVPQQALALANSALTHECAAVLAKRLHAEAGTDAEFVRLAFLTVLSRPPTTEEAGECEAFLRGKEAVGREGLVRVLFNHHEFVMIR